MTVGPGGIVVFKEGFNQARSAFAGYGRVVDNSNGLGVASASRTDLSVGGVCISAAHVADGRCPDAFLAPEDTFNSPEAARGKVEHLEAGGDRISRARSVYRVKFERVQDWVPASRNICGKSARSRGV